VLNLFDSTRGRSSSAGDQGIGHLGLMKNNLNANAGDGPGADATKTLKQETAGAGGPGVNVTKASKGDGVLVGVHKLRPMQIFSEVKLVGGNLWETHGDTNREAGERNHGEGNSPATLGVNVYEGRGNESDGSDNVCVTVNPTPTVNPTNLSNFKRTCASSQSGSLAGALHLVHQSEQELRDIRVFEYEMETLSSGDSNTVSVTAQAAGEEPGPEAGSDEGFVNSFGGPFGGPFGSSRAASDLSGSRGIQSVPMTSGDQGLAPSAQPAQPHHSLGLDSNDVLRPRIYRIWRNYNSGVSNNYNVNNVNNVNNNGIQNEAVSDSTIHSKTTNDSGDADQTTQKGAPKDASTNATTETSTVTFASVLCGAGLADTEAYVTELFCEVQQQHRSQAMHDRNQAIPLSLEETIQRSIQQFQNSSNSNQRNDETSRMQRTRGNANGNANANERRRKAPLDVAIEKYVQQARILEKEIQSVPVVNVRIENSESSEGGYHANTHSNTNTNTGSSNASKPFPTLPNLPVEGAAGDGATGDIVPSRNDADAGAGNNISPEVFLKSLSSVATIAVESVLSFRFLLLKYTEGSRLDLGITHVKPSNQRNAKFAEDLLGVWIIEASGKFAEDLLGVWIIEASGMLGVWIIAGVQDYPKRKLMIGN
jgi:hypothetical protein